MQHSILFSALAISFSLYFVAPSLASPLDRLKKDATETAKTVEDADEELEKSALKDICFVKNDTVWIRLTPAQFQSAKARAHLKQNGVVRIQLNNRQMEALKDALGSKLKASKVILKVRAERLQNSKGLKGRFVVRPISRFEKKGVLEEKE